MLSGVLLCEKSRTVYVTDMHNHHILHGILPERLFAGPNVANAAVNQQPNPRAAADAVSGGAGVELKVAAGQIRDRQTQLQAARDALQEARTAPWL